MIVEGCMILLHEIHTIRRCWRLWYSIHSGKSCHQWSSV